MEKGKRLPRYTIRKACGSWQIMLDGVDLYRDGLTRQQALKAVRALNNEEVGVTSCQTA